MEIQKILFPRIGLCTEKALYFRTNTVGKIQYSYEKQTIEFDERGKVWFDTYFNGLSVEKWRKYTTVRNVFLRITISGKFKVLLISKEKLDNKVLEKVLYEQMMEAGQPQSFELPYADGSHGGMCAFCLESMENGSALYGGAYCTDAGQGRTNSIKIGIGICTYQREAFVERNLKILRESVLQNTQSPLYGHLEILISDNGKTLDRNRLQSDHIHIYPNRNLGGAGGFTRAMIEMMQDSGDARITHVLLMDDDIVIDPEVLVRTYMLLSLIKDEYRDSFIGGAMLRLDLQYRQVEAGAAWNGGRLTSLKGGLDLRTCSGCLDNEVEEYAEYNAWWYCCFPIGIVRPDNLPLPIFIRGDDVEYGLRNMRKLILMNGICVWHEPFENKYASFLEYYIMRNQLIDNAFHCRWYGRKQVNSTMFRHCIREIMLYRYKNVDLYLQGIKDFLKGPGWLMEQDGEVLHRKVLSEGYRGQNLEDLQMGFSYPAYVKSLETRGTAISNIMRILTFNGLLFPAKGENIVSMSAARTPDFFRKKRVMHYDASARKAFVTERSLGLSLQCVFKTVCMLFAVSFKLGKAQRAYREEGLKLRTLEFWKGYLGI